MIMIKTIDGEKRFNLKTSGYPGEIRLCQTITRLMIQNSTATINIKTSNNKLSVKISDIFDLKFNESDVMAV